MLSEQEAPYCKRLLARLTSTLRLLAVCRVCPVLLSKTRHKRDVPFQTRAGRAAAACCGSCRCATCWGCCARTPTCTAAPAARPCPACTLTTWPSSTRRAPPPGHCTALWSSVHRAAVLACVCGHAHLTDGPAIYFMLANLVPCREVGLLLVTTIRDYVNFKPPLFPCAL